MICNILDTNATELYMIKYTIGEIFSSGGATFYKNPSDQTVSTRGSVCLKNFWTVNRISFSRKKISSVYFVKISNFSSQPWTLLYLDFYITELWAECWHPVVPYYYAESGLKIKHKSITTLYIIRSFQTSGKAIGA